MKCKVMLLMVAAAAAAFSTATLPVVQPDNYEPNNSFAAAYPLAMGDSVVKNATVFGSVGFDSGTISIGSGIDVDIYKVTLSRGTMVSATAFRWYNGTSEDTSIAKWRWRIFICDTLYKIVCGGTPIIEAFQPHYNGVFYVAVTSILGIDYACRYGLSISERAVLSQQSMNVPDTGLHEDTSGYRMNVSFDTTDLNVNITLNEKVSGRISAKVLLPGEFDTAVNTQGAIKTVWIEADQSIISSIKAADIIFPYAPEDLSGCSQKSLKVMRLNDTTHQWEPVLSSIDSVNHTITAHTTHFSIYGVFITANTATNPSSAKSVDAFGVKADFQPGKRSITVNFSLPKATSARMALYNLQGKCVQKSMSFSVSPGNSTSLLNVENCANGKYFLDIKAGSYQMKQTILIMK